MTIEKNLKLTNVFAAFCNTWFFVPILVPYARDYMHVGFHGVIFSESVFALMLVALDVPSGWLSDTWKRKNILILGAMMNVAGCLTPILFPSMAGLILSQIFCGLGISFFNGTHTALLYESLDDLKRENEYRRREGFRGALSYYGMTTAAVIGSLSYTLDPHLPFLFGAITQIIAALTAFKMVEPHKHRHSEEKHPVRDIVETFKFVATSSSLAALVILIGGVLFSGTKVVMWGQQPYYAAMGIPVGLFGVLMAIGWLLGGIASQNAHRFDGKINNLTFILASFVAVVAACLIAGASLSYIGIAAMLFSSCVYGSTMPRINEIVNRSVDASRRATLLSTQSFLASLMFIPSSNIMGWITNHKGISAGYLCSAAWLVAMGCLLFLWKRRTLAKHRR